MFSLVRKVVAGPKRTTNCEGVELDLTYISERIIAMAFPASDILEKTYRNKIEDVSHYLQQQHPASYLIINVSSRVYDYELFENRVKDFEWADHQAPTLTTLIRIGYEMYLFLREDKGRVVAVHCNHGKGRTGTAIISFLLLIGYSHSAAECLKFYNFRRFNKETYGVDQPCQVRYLNYIERLIVSHSLHKKLACLRLHAITHRGLNESYYVRIKSTKSQETVYEKAWVNREVSQSSSKFLMGDIFIELFAQNWMGDKRVSRVNYNLYFLEKNLELTLRGSSIKVENHSKQFEVTLHFQYHCLCHLPTYNETLCPCNYARNIEEMEWGKMIASINACKKLESDEISFLVHGEGLPEESQAEEEIAVRQEHEHKCERSFKNSREERIYNLAQKKHILYRETQQMLEQQQSSLVIQPLAQQQPQPIQSQPLPQQQQLLPLLLEQPLAEQQDSPPLQ